MSTTAPTLVTVATTRDARTIHVAEHLEHGLTLAPSTLCGKSTARMRADTWAPTPTCRVCTVERNRLLSAARTVEAQVAADVARGGWAGPPRTSTSLRFTLEQLAALDAAVEAGYAEGRNAVVARLVDEQLSGAVLVATSEQRAALELPR